MFGGEQFAICFGLVVISLWNVLEVLNVGGGALCMMFQRLCVLCL